MTEPNPDQRVAAKLGMNPEAVGIIRQRWNDANETPIVREIIGDRIQQLVAELERKLRKCPPDELKTLQGALDAYEKAISTLNSRL